MAQKPETRFRNSRVVPFLKTLKNTYFWSVQQIALRGDADICLCIWGRYVALELKSDGNEPSPLQQYKLDRITKAGGLALVSDPIRWPQIKQILSEMDRNKETAWKMKSP